MNDDHNTSKYLIPCTSNGRGISYVSSLYAGPISISNVKLTDRYMGKSEEETYIH